MTEIYEEKLEPVLERARKNTERNLRVRCVELANNPHLTDKELVDRAQKIYWFITAKDKDYAANQE